MCGLAGFLESNLNDNNSAKVLHSMGESIYRRGPDGTGIWFENIENKINVGFVHTRLAIIDLSDAGQQPMHSHCGRYVIAFNGEIYNHLELRYLLESNNHISWRGHSDTETLLACFGIWGIDKTLQACVGMFAIALWDKKEHRLTLARDRVGEKPLYWGWQDDALLFGSELKALKTHPAFSAEINRDALCLLLRHNYIPAPHTIYRGIQKLQPGHYLSVELSNDERKETLHQYWSYEKVVQEGLVNPFMGSPIQAVEHLESLIAQSINGQLISDVPLGAFLSGGIDSSLIVSIMQSLSSSPVKTFSIGFDDKKYDEAIFAVEVARHLGTEHTEMYVNDKDIQDVIPLLPEVYCEPFADSSQLPTFLVSKMAQQHVTVALSGDAGDELFGGYTPYSFTPKYWNYARNIPLQIRKFASRYIDKLPVNPKFKKLIECMAVQNPQLFYRNIISHWLNPEELVKNSSEPSTAFSSSTTFPVNGGYVDWMMSVDAQVYMTDDILVKVDRAAMYNSLETRVPLLDHRIIEFAWQLPVSLKINNGVGKWPLREILYKRVPKSMIERPKKGFSVPLSSWLRGPLRDWAEELIAYKRLADEGYFNVAAVRSCWNLHIQGQADYSRKLWSILMFQSWLENQK
ncbi:TPA: asparagine synthase (glutamine-hydrolyzing) [Escherichia coli]|nr:asparagine synthase (glutamine-hydrolyzing) [Escherichia coli]HCJ8491859.1 asparagine synthase (glutamine-hydrolyzing) [Escherichia coli]